MKHLLLPIAMLIGCFCFGQKKDSLIFGGKIIYPVWKEGGETSTGSNKDLWVTSTLKQDTIKCIMLVCDTATKLNNEANPYLLAMRNPLAYWQYGYEVMEAWMYFDDGGWAYRAIKQLDENKKLLPASVIVWITKEIKQ